MDGLWGWFGEDSSAPEVVGAMAAGIEGLLENRLSTASIASGSVAGVSNAEELDVFRQDGLALAVWGRLRFADSDLAGIALRHGVAEALAHGYRHRRADVFSLMTGSFALAVLDDRAGDAFLAVDRMGTRPLWYSTGSGPLLFGSTLDVMEEMGGRAGTIDPQALYDYVYFHMVPGPRTIYADRRRLLPGTYLRWHGGTGEVHCHWKMQFVENEAGAFSERRSRFLHLLRNSVRDAVADAGEVGAFLSGGTDSSTVAGLLGDVTGAPARTYSIGFDVDGYDELSYAHIAASHFGTRHHEYRVSPEDVVSAIPLIAAEHDQPFGNSSAVPAYYCAKLAREDGIETLLGGDGGDELFGGNDRYAKQHLYSLYSDLPQGLRRHVIEPFAALLPSRGIAGKARRYLRNASEPMPARYDNYNLLMHFGPQRVFGDDFLAAVDWREPHALMEETYHGAAAGSLINRMLALDLRFTLADNDLPKVRHSCRLAGVDVRFPLLDDALVAFSARLTPREKLNGTRLRYFFKEALRGYLPEATIRKTKHGFGLPFGPWLQSHARLQEIVQDTLSDLRRRHIVRPDFLDELTTTRVQQHSAYYGTMLWVLMMLEQWFQRRPASASAIRKRHSGDLIHDRHAAPAAPAMP